MATSEAGSSTRVSQAAKRPAKTETFSKSLRVALSIFDDEVTTLSDVRETAYENFIVAYKTAFTDIWPKINGADIEVILDSVKDTELRQLRRMADMLSPAEEQPKLVEATLCCRREEFSRSSEPRVTRAFNDYSSGCRTTKPPTCLATGPSLTPSRTTPNPYDIKYVRP